MWNKTAEEERAQKPLPPRNGAPEPSHNASAPTAVPAKTVPPEPPRGAVVGTSMTIKGEIYSREELYVDGEVEGALELQHRLTVGPNGKVRANVKAKEVIVHGSIRGNVEAAAKIAIRKDASIVGDVKTAGIVIDDGAYFKGSIDIVKPELTKPEPVHAEQKH